MNSHKIRPSKDQQLPSGIPKIIYENPNIYGLQDMLQEVNRNTVKEVMEQLGGEDLLRFVPASYEEKAKAVEEELYITDKFTIYNAWAIYDLMIRKMPEPEEAEVQFVMDA